ncbi:winged helix-turn-helix domain-containing protein [Cellulomonas sp. ACRRI]|uniref:ArsR/SmtB family transcription factor n=1 Tax=Cellulomonas sp. ACRRI TaxID=2918188 RepID=UPI001EF1AE11|nr:winged helix-turn-helix domain-containing protein [Cellulomonas sp. ACRRI]MCG7286516.1 winged helix-turn-helix domain-containing protein [Cellulomonas sp. ACRRI]
MTTAEHDTDADDPARSAAAPGRSAGTMRVTDPTRVRALAHPVRMDLLSFLDDVGEATATECAVHLGQTVANCSFHLRTLAKAGYIEPAEPRGRERPWRVVSRERNITPDPLDPASRRAVLELAEISVRREAERYIDHLRHLDHEGVADPELIPLTQLTTSAFWATPAETAELIEGMHALMKRFDGRTADPAIRPGGARMMRLLTAINPDMAFEPTAEAAPPAPQQED